MDIIYIKTNRKFKNKKKSNASLLKFYHSKFKEKLDFNIIILTSS